MLSSFPESQLAFLALVREQQSRIRDLKGFRKSHQVPGEVNDHTRAFAGRIAADDISDDLNVRFDDFRRILGFRRTQLQVCEPEAGVGGIVTPSFEYQMSVRLSEEDSATVIVRRQLREFHPEHHSSIAALSTVFGTLFDTVEYSPDISFDLTQFVDDLEDRKPDGVTLDYDRHVTWCQVSIPGTPGLLRLTTNQLSMSVSQPLNPERLMSAFFAFYSRVADSGGLMGSLPE